MHRFCLAYLCFAVTEWDPKLFEWYPADSRGTLLHCFSSDFLKCGEEPEFHGDLLSLMSIAKYSKIAKNWPLMHSETQVS